MFFAIEEGVLAGLKRGTWGDALLLSSVISGLSSVDLRRRDIRQVCFYYLAEELKGASVKQETRRRASFSYLYGSMGPLFRYECLVYRMYSIIIFLLLLV